MSYRKVADLDQYVKNNKISFLPHNAVYRSNAESTKCRIVSLSNLCENFNNFAVSHNQCSYPGANLNHKLQVALLLLRLDIFLLAFYIKKAFLQLMLREEDTNKLLFLWVNDVDREDYSIVAYRFLRVPFSLRFSPFLLMMALHIILMTDVENDDVIMRELKNNMDNLAYMDNVSFTTNSEEDIIFAYKISKEIFEKYKISLQQFSTNSGETQIRIGENISPDNDSKLFGLLWDKNEDTMRVRELYLNTKAIS